MLSEQHAPTLITRRPDSRVHHSVSLDSPMPRRRSVRACGDPAGDAIRAMRASFPRRLQPATFQALASCLSLFALQAQAGVLVDRDEIVEARLSCRSWGHERRLASKY